MVHAEQLSAEDSKSSRVWKSSNFSTVQFVEFPVLELTISATVRHLMAASTFLLTLGAR